jgi:hypothetical protein
MCIMGDASGEAGGPKPFFVWDFLPAHVQKKRCRLAVLASGFGKELTR